jgi:hypothetical protein
MKSYTKVDVTEQRFEGLVQQDPGLIEEGLMYIDHQKRAAGRRLDVLMVDSGKSLVVAELKVVQDEDMLVQGLDYYDFVSSNIEAFARLYKNFSIDPTQKVRLLLIAPDFTQRLVNRCKWLDLPISLFTFTCLKCEGQEDIVPVFTERDIPVRSEPPEVHTREEILSYITDETIRNNASSLLNEIAGWKENILLDPIKEQISMKVNNRVFAYLWAARKHYVVSVYDAEGNPKNYQVKGDQELASVKPILREAMERSAGTAAAASARIGD